MCDITLDEDCFEDLSLSCCEPTSIAEESELSIFGESIGASKVKVLELQNPPSPQQCSITIDSSFCSIDSVCDLKLSCSPSPSRVAASLCHQVPQFSSTPLKNPNKATTDQTQTLCSQDNLLQQCEGTAEIASILYITGFI